jgi:hypothetical protein
VTFTAAQVDALIAEKKTIPAMPPLVQRDGFARFRSRVFVQGTVDIVLVMEAHLGLRCTTASPNVVLRWGNVRIRGIDEAMNHPNVAGYEPVAGWHEHIWRDEFGDRLVVPVEPAPPQGLTVFFEFAAKRWNIDIQSGSMPALEFEP